jgi:hypothetical protein
MGYTHQWESEAIADDGWAKLLDAANRIMGAADVRLAGPMGDGEPVLDDQQIALNGVAADEEGYETFALDASGGRDFCKTARRPYDTVVTAILLRAALTVPGFSVSSDGQWSEWEDGRALYTRVFGEAPAKPDGLRAG